MSDNQPQSEFEKFKATWNKLIPKIEGATIDGEGVSDIMLWFNTNKLKCNTGETEELHHQEYVEGDLLECELVVALSTAHSRFRLANRGALAKVFGGVVEKGVDLTAKR